MPHLHIHASNRPERLLDALVEVVGVPPADPMVPEVVAVGHPGTGKWLAQQLSQRLGIWANGRFVTLPRLTAGLAEQAAPEACRWEAGVLTWLVHRLLPGLAALPEFLPLQQYLAGEGAGRRFQLSVRLGALLRRYIDWRPDLLSAWERGTDAPTPPDHWQPLLWCAVREGLGGDPLLERARLLDLLPSLALPPRLCVYGPVGLTPFQVDLLNRLSQRIPVHVFHVEPSTGRTSTPLAESMGAAARDLRELLSSRCPDARWTDLHEPAVGGTTLAALHEALAGNPTAPPPPDGTLAVHRCHGPMREVEVLHEQLLTLFDATDAPEPHEVLVLAPDIDRYGPLVDAVLGSHEQVAHAPGVLGRIPFTLSDSTVRAAAAEVDTFRAALALVGSRLPASAVLDLLGRAPVLARYGLDPARLDDARALITEVGVRWGLDGAHRAEAGLPAADDLHTWNFGVDRLMLGFAMPELGRTLFAGVLPFDPVEGDSADLAGRVALFVQTVLPVLRHLEHPRAAGEWLDALTGLLDALTVDEGQPQRGVVSDALRCLSEETTAAGLEEPLPFEAVHAWLEARLAHERREQAFLHRGVTFASLVPGRCVPFRAVFVLGLDDDAFPRGGTPAAFDLVAAAPRPGDPDPRHADRGAFGEAVLAARDRLVLSFTGSSQHRALKHPPSVVVEEVLDAAGASRVEVAHPLQPFDAHYFDVGGPIWSYSLAWAAAARAARGRRSEPRVFLPGPLPPPPVDVTRGEQVNLGELGRFLAFSCKHLLQRRLGLWLEDQVSQVPDREAFELDALQAYNCRSSLAGEALDGLPPRDAFGTWSARGALPQGVPGRLVFEDIAVDASAFAAAVGGLLAGPVVAPLAVTLRLDGACLVGEIGGLWPAHHLRWRPSSLKAGDLLPAWVEHLALCATAGAHPRRTLVCGWKEVLQVVTFGPVDGANTVLAELLALWREGQRRPLRLFPRSSPAYAQEWALSADPDKAMRAARDAWMPWNRPGDAQDPWIRRAFGHERDALSADDPAGTFSELALRVYRPMFAAQEGDDADARPPGGRR